eukprot:1994316-Pyramimonas_sp.AAC.1
MHRLLRTIFSFRSCASKAKVPLALIASPMRPGNGLRRHRKFYRRWCSARWTLGGGWAFWRFNHLSGVYIPEGEGEEDQGGGGCTRYCDKF